MPSNVFYCSEVTRLVETLQLSEHPEGGFYRETYRSAHSLEVARVTQGDIPQWRSGIREAQTASPGATRCERSLVTLIYYLLPAGIESRIHRILSDEIWLWQGGGILDIRSHNDGRYASHLLGHASGAKPQLTIAAGTWFNAVVVEGDFVLAACMVAPGFDFADLEMWN